MEDKIEKIIDELDRLSTHYEDCASKALEKCNIAGAQLHSTEASAFTRARWIVEDIWNEGESND